MPRTELLILTADDRPRAQCPRKGPSRSNHDPATGVLRNHLGIRDQQGLEIAERYLVATRASQGLPERAERLDTGGLQAIHGHLFQDIYAWAGQVRSYTTGRGPVPFAPPEQVVPWLDRQFDALKQENGLKNLAPTTFAERAAHYVNEINAAHPFVEGNGRVQRTWLRNLATRAGHQIQLRSSDKDRWYDASRIGFEQANNDPMASLIQDAMERQRAQQQERKPEPEQTRVFVRSTGPAKERSR